MKKHQRFIYEYGSFVLFWSNFEIMLEIAIFERNELSAIENCEKYNKLTAGQKRGHLSKILEKNEELEVLDALERVFVSAERNDWLHGHILNPNGDWSKMTRLRVKPSSGTISVENEDIDLNSSPFQEFYSAWQSFMDAADISVSRGNDYIREIQGLPPIEQEKSGGNI